MRWVIAYFDGKTKYYYRGFFKAGNGNMLRPAVDADIKKALILHDREQATTILSELNIDGWFVDPVDMGITEKPEKS